MSKNKQPECPHCGSINVELLPGGVVYECLELNCNWAFTGPEVTCWRTTESVEAERHRDGLEAAALDDGTVEVPGT